MLSLTRKTDYALIAAAYLADRHRRGQGPASARTIAEAFDLPRPLLMNVLKSLSQEGLVSSTRGAGGGYELAADPARLDLLTVARAVEGAGEAEDHPAIRRLRDRLEAELAGLTLADLLEDF
ncbi:MAG: Rrf2 family transcriptional regulator [Phycisphaeraceae bacterium]